jgi:hypothetical protein
MDNARYRLPGGKGFLYVVELYPGCRDCSAPPGITIYRVTPKHWLWEEIKDYPELPSFDTDDMRQFVIKCGPDPDEFTKETNRQAVAGAFEIYAAEYLAELVWDKAIRGSVRAVEMRNTNGKNRRDSESLMH